MFVLTDGLWQSQLDMEQDDNFLKSFTVAVSGKRWAACFVLVLISGENLGDVIVDLNNGATNLHLVVETVFSIIGFAMAYFLLKSLLLSKSELRSTRLILAKTQAEADKWQAESKKLMTGLSSAIESQFTNWHFTPAEREIGFYLIQGLSLKEIAELRKVSERTVRQQTLTIYDKSGVAGRAELSAFFLKNLLPEKPIKTEPGIGLS